MHPKELIKQRVIAFEDWGLEIWKVHVDALKEQDKNARYMDNEIFARLVENVKKDKRLESLPYCVYRNGRIEIISGHHRVRAARQAGVNEIYVLVDVKELSDAEVKSKQLAHNKLVGKDDPAVLREIYDEIDDLNLKIATGLTQEDFGLKVTPENVKVDVSFDFDFTYKKLVLLFLPSEFDKFNQVCDLLEDADEVGLLDKRQYNKFRRMLLKVCKKENIRNLSAAMSKIMDIVKEYYEKESRQTE